MPCPRVVRETNLEDDDVDEHEEDASGVTGLVVCADVLPLKKGFG